MGESETLLDLKVQGTYETEQAPFDGTAEENIAFTE